VRPFNAILSPQIETKAARRRRRLALFRPPFRRYVAGLTSTSAAIEDLADSFPALLFALATGYGTVTEREAAFRAVVDGKPLKEAAAILGLPFWTRRIPAASLAHDLPALPCDEEFAAEVVNRIPQTVVECQAWLDRVATGLRLVGRDMAIWIIREPRLMPPLIGEETFHWLLAWAWASVATTSPGHRLLRGAWTPGISVKRALDEVAIWRKRIDLVGALADHCRDPWYANSKAGGFEIVQLTSVEDFITESEAMENCLDQYAAHLAYGRVRIFSVRRDGKPVADVELSVRSDRPTEAVLSQVRGPRNKRASAAVWQAVTAWLDTQTPRVLNLTVTPRPFARAQLDEFWAPYIRAIDAAALTLRLPTAVVTGDRILPNARPVRIMPPVPVEDALPVNDMRQMVQAAGRGR